MSEVRKSNDFSRTKQPTSLWPVFNRIMSSKKAAEDGSNLHLDHFLASCNAQQERLKKEYKTRRSMQHFLRIIFQAPVIHNLGTTKTEATFYLSLFFYEFAQLCLNTCKTCCSKEFHTYLPLLWRTICPCLTLTQHPSTCTSTEICAYASGVCTVLLQLQMTPTLKCCQNTSTLNV